MFSRLSGLAALALLALGACDRGPADEPLLVISGPEAFERLELRDGRDRVIWRLAADEPAPLERLVYGDVPPGFRQEAPAGGAPPRELLAGEPLLLESVTPLRVFRHWGFAQADRRLSIDSWEMELREPPGPAALDGSTGAS